MHLILFDKEGVSMITDNYSDVFGSLFEGVYIVDMNRKIIFWNKACEQITGYSKEEVMNAHCYNNILRHVTMDGKELCIEGCPLHDTLATGKINENEIFLHHAEGHRIPVSVKTMPIRDDEGNIVAAVEVFQDTRLMQNLKQHNQSLHEMISKDDLTQILNRRFVNFYLKNAIAEAEEFKHKFGILFIDIDDFKFINDRYGHDIGDEVLKVLSSTLRNNIRITDIAGRWGGEEFIVVLKVDTLEVMYYVAEKLRQLVGKSTVNVKGEEISVSVSIGGTLYLEGDSVGSLIKRADTNMYEAKAAGKNRTKVN